VSEREPSPLAEAEAWPTFVALGGGLSLGLVPQPLTLGWLGVETGPRSFGLTASAFVTPEATAMLAPGAVGVRFAGGMLRGCFVLAGARSSSDVAVCAFGAVASLRGVATGYPETGRARYRPWYAAGLEVEGAWGFSPLFGARASAGLAAPLHEESFSIRRVGTAFETPPVLGWLRIGLAARLF
jgi:hypothetical protein